MEKLFTLVIAPILVGLVLELVSRWLDDGQKEKRNEPFSLES